MEDRGETLRNLVNRELSKFDKVVRAEIVEQGCGMLVSPMCVYTVNYYDSTSQEEVIRTAISLTDSSSIEHYIQFVRNVMDRHVLPHIIENYTPFYC